MRFQPAFEQMDDSQAIDRGPYRQIHRGARLDDQRPARIDPHHLARAFELPDRHRTAGEAPTQARMVEQVARMLRPAVRGQIGG